MSASVKSLLLNTLKSLGAAADVGLEFTEHPYRYLYKDIFEEYQIRKNSFDVAVHRTIKAGWVEKIKKNGEIYLRLTTKGYTKLIGLERLTKQEWDGFWRIVVFDIPEKSKRIRNSLRRNLTALGFVPWQKSVWVSPLSHERLVSGFLKENNLEEFAVVLKTNDILIEKPEAFREFVKEKLATDMRPKDWK